MTKPYTEDDLSRLLTEDRTWRLKEISDLKSAIIKSDQASKPVLLRALVAIAYAHWEGNVRFSARLYMEHIALRKFTFSELNRQFFRNYFLPRLGALSINRSSLSDRCRLVDEVLDGDNRQFRRPPQDLINTKANLNFDVFSDICLVCGIEAESFEDSRKFVDLELLARRNAIAHGEETYIELKDMDSLAERTISLMRQFGDQLENKVVLQTFRAARPTADA